MFSPAARVQYIAHQIANSTFIRPRTLEDHNVRLLYLNTAMIGVGSGGIAAFLPIYLARLGASPTLLGWLVSAPAFLAILFLLPGAVVAERARDQVKMRCFFARLIYSGYLLCAVAPFFLTGPALMWVLVALWTLKTLPDAVGMPSWTPVVARAVSPERRARMNGARWALLSVVSAVSSAFFGWMLDRVAFPLNYQLVFFISFAVSWLDPFFFSFIRVPAPPSITLHAVAGVKQRLADFFAPLASGACRPFWVFIFSTIAYRIALNLPAPVLSLFWVNKLHTTNTLLGLRGTVGYGTLVVGYIFWGRIANRLKHRNVLTLGALGLAIYCIVTAFAPSPIWLLPAAAIWGLTAGAVDIGLFDLFLASCPKERQPLFVAFWSIAANTAAFVGPLIGAAISDATSLSTALVIGGVAQILAIIPFVFLPRDV